MCVCVCVQDTARRIAKVSVEAKLKVEEDEYVEGFKPHMMDVVHAWCKGATFAQICRMTDIFEGQSVCLSHTHVVLVRGQSVCPSHSCSPSAGSVSVPLSHSCSPSVLTADLFKESIFKT